MSLREGTFVVSAVIGPVDARNLASLACMACGHGNNDPFGTGTSATPPAFFLPATEREAIKE
jgi:hypothetical protein